MGACIATNVDFHDDFILPEPMEKNAPKRQREQLLACLKHPQLALLFREFLRSIFCVEGFSLFMDVEDYKEVNDPEELKERAQYIFEKYFTVDSEYEINVEGALVEMLRESTQKPDKETFDLVQQLVLVTLEGTCLPQFLNWKLYLEFISDPITRKVFLGGISRTHSYYQIEKYTQNARVKE